MRLNYPKIGAEAFQKLLDTKTFLDKSGLEEGLLHIVYLRVSQINSCPYCVDLHWRDAVKMGMDPRKLNAVIIWKDAPFFSPQESAALEWAEAVTNTVCQTKMQEVFERAKAQFSEKELVDLTFAIAQMNTFNRIAIAFHAVPQK